MFLGSLVLLAGGTEVVRRDNRLAEDRRAEPGTDLRGPDRRRRLMGITVMLEEVYGVQVWLLIMTIGATVAYALVLQSVSGTAEDGHGPVGDPVAAIRLDRRPGQSDHRGLVGSWSAGPSGAESVAGLRFHPGLFRDAGPDRRERRGNADPRTRPGAALVSVGLFLAGRRGSRRSATSWRTVCTCGSCTAIRRNRISGPTLASHCARCKFAILIHLVVAALVAWMVGVGAAEVSLGAPALGSDVQNSIFAGTSCSMWLDHRPRKLNSVRLTLIGNTSP